MNRRAFLVGLGATVVAGCTGRGADAGGGDGTTAQSTTQRTTTRPTTTDPDPGVFGYMVDEIRTADAPAPDVTVDVSVTQQFTFDHPAGLRVAVTNDADRERTFQFGSLVPWDELWGQRQGGAGELLLNPDADVAPEEPSDNCWRATDGVALPAVMQSKTLAAGETAAREFTVLASHDSESCHEQGTYRFADDSYLESGFWFEVDIVPVVE